MVFLMNLMASIITSFVWRIRSIVRAMQGNRIKFR